MKPSAGKHGKRWHIEDNVTVATYQQLLRIAEPLTLPQGAVLIAEGEQDRTLFLLQSGSLSVSQYTDDIEQQLGTIKAGDVAGEIAFVNEGPRLATVTIREEAQLLKLDHLSVISMLAEHPAVLADLMRALAARVALRLREHTIADNIQSQASKKSVMTDASAAIGTSTESYLERLTREAFSHPAVCHPYLTDLAGGHLPDQQWAIRDFATQYPGYSAHFPRYLTAVISKLECPGHRKTLMENLTEENGMLDDGEIAVLLEHGIDPDWVQGISHPKLFERFQHAIGIHEGDRNDDDAIEVACWRESFYNLLANGSPAEAIGAIGLGTENIVNSIYTPIIRAINRLGTLNRRDYVFFELHCEVDKDHHEALLRIAHDFADCPVNRIDLRKGMLKALGLRSRFWDWMHARAKKRSPGA
ncbi:MAG: iron-containing redox enzyme family protein [Verrucomicrobiales bacterium]